MADTGSRDADQFPGGCTYEYPHAGSVANPQDVNNAYSWICVAPKTGTSSADGTRISAVNKGTSGSALVVVTPGGESVFDNGPAGSVSYEGNNGVTSPLTYEGSVAGRCSPTKAVAADRGLIPTKLLHLRRGLIESAIPTAA